MLLDPPAARDSTSALCVCVCVEPNGCVQPKQSRACVCVWMKRHMALAVAVWYTTSIIAIIPFCTVIARISSFFDM